MARQMMSLCVTLGDDPYIRYYAGTETSQKLCKIVAKAISTQLQNLKDTVGNEWKPKTRVS